MTRAVSDSPEQNEPPPRLSRRRLVGRRVARGLYYAVAAAVAAAATVQITQQVFFAASEASRPAPSSCAEGLTALYRAIEQGRAAADRAHPDESEEAPLERFREAVTPAWRQREAVARSCRDRSESRRLLDALERLRYSEEHGVRHQATELTALRRRVRKLMEQSFGEPPEASR
jgi:hypothetical protein